MDDLFIHRHAQRLGINHVVRLVALERRPRTLAVGQLLGEPVELFGRDAGFDGGRQLLEDFGHDHARPMHQRELFGTLEQDHAGLPFVAGAAAGPRASRMRC